MPAALEIITMRPPRAITSSTLDSVFSKRSSGGARTITGTLSPISAIGVLHLAGRVPSVWT
jgi:hypothetical protein